MIKSIEFREGVLTLAISSPRRAVATECKCSIEFDFSQSSTVAKFHGGKLMDLVNAIYPEGAHQVCNLILELVRAKPGVCRIDFYRFNSRGEPLEASAAPDVGIQFASGALQRASGEEDIAF